MALARLFASVAVGALIAAQTHAQGMPTRWRLVEVWRSGGDAERSPAFSDVVDMQLAPNGHLLVLIGGDRPALVSIDNTGRPVRSVGGTTGPPLLDRPNGFAQFADGRIVINDPRVGRFSVLSEAGRFLREIDYQPWGYTARWLGFTSPDGALVEPVADGGRLVWRRWSSDFASSQLMPVSGCDFGLTAAGPETAFRINGRTRQVTVPVPFLQPPIAFVRGPDGASWAGLGPDYRRIVRTPWLACEDVAEITLEGDPLSIPVDTRLAAQQRVRQMAIDIGASVAPDVERIPATLPLFHTIRVDAANRLWVERHVTPERRAFTVYTADGRRRAEVRQVPIDIDILKPVAFSDTHLFGFTSDESDWTWLVALRIERVD